MSNQVKDNEQRVKTDNEVIADFIGRRLWSKDDLKDGRMQQWELPMCSGYYPTTLLFHEKWDWLMPVISKIEELEHNPHNGIFYNLTAKMEWLKVLSLTIDTPIDVVYKAVVNWIHWYQKQKSS